MKQILMFVFGVPEELPPMMNEARTLADRGYVVRILGLRRKPEDPAYNEAGGLFIHRMYLRSRHFVGDRDAFEIVRYGEAVLRSFVWGFFHRAAMIVAHDLVTLPQTYPLAFLKRIPLVYRAHELWGEQKAAFSRAGLWKRLDSFFVPRVDLVVAPESNRGRVYRNEFKAGREPLIVYNCTRLRPIPPRPVLEERLRSTGSRASFAVYYQGGISSDRMIGNLVEAMTFVTDEVALVLVGRMEPAFTRWCADYCRRSGSGHRIIHIEHVPYGEELFALCAGANVGVMFVRGDCRNNIFNVTAANKLFEYMMMGVPVLTVDFAAHREFVEGKGIGRCVNAEDPESIGRVIMEMFRDREATAAMGARARHLAEQEFNWEEQSRKLIAAYENLILGRASTYGTQGTPGS